jgi:hypothetical protein
LPNLDYSIRMTLTDIDLWIGKTLFVPPIIKLCQITRQSQFAISRLFWFVVALDQLRVAETLASQILAGLFSIVMMVTASLRADMPAFSMMWFRMLAIGFLALDVAQAMNSGAWRGVEIWLLVLVAEYATTIVTIPPSEVRKTRSVAVTEN